MDVPLVKNTNFTVQFVLDKLSASLSPENFLDANLLQDFQIKQISDESAFMSTIYRINFSWKRSSTTNDRPSNWPTSVVLKVPGAKYDELIAKSKEQTNEDDDLFREFFFDYLEKAHKREVNFYNCYHCLDPANQFLPKLFYGSDYCTQHNEGLIIMEDLSDRACSAPVLPGLNDAQVHAVLAAIARMHATAWAHRAELIRQVWNNGSMDSWALNPPFVRSMVEASQKLAKIEPNAIGPLVHRLLPLIRVDKIALSFYDENKYGFPACFVHADLWAPNIMWSKNAEGRASDNLCAIIDWQTVHSGNPCEDICRLLALNTPSAYRRANTDKLLAFYAEKVTEFMGGNRPFTMAQLKKAFSGAMPYVMMFLCYGTTVYCTMDTVVGKEGTAEREELRAELFDRVQSFLEDTEKEFLDEI